ncbi:cytochrome c oxidase subunit IV-domain-containing protein [Lentinula aciculospora]|uniref:Cytochrome c oxidase subunit IV-domain-containing protein n=1 Tax=Lentinula aciculospora TaxID=153920 RepID=A0A9W9ASI6_9AGAR|nr:cytochrome c oxidase subunit IV-domain-containing protein [Lentinula aciculospora]
MQAALRLARHNASLRSATSVRCLATTANPSHVASSSASSSTSFSKASIIPLSNVEAQWEKMSAEDKSTVHEQLEEVMKKDWKQLSLDEKKAAYYVAFGPHGPRAPVSKPGDALKIFAGTAAAVGVAGIMYYLTRIFSPAPPRTINKEWQEASNERALEQKMNPITGIASEGYTGKGFVQK